MAHGLNSVLKRTVSTVASKSEGCNHKPNGGIGSRRIFSPQFKLQVLDSYRSDADCKGNQRATARKYGIHRRQIQKWLQVENTLRNNVKNNEQNGPPSKTSEVAVALIGARPRVDDDPSAAAATTTRMDPLPPAQPLNFARQQFVYSTSLQVARPTVVITSSSTPLDPSAPMDLSVKKCMAAGSNSSAPATPLPQITSPPPRLLQSVISSSSTSLVSSPPSLPQSPTTATVWDLSTKSSSLKRKHEDSDNNNNSTTTSPKPVKLFKPYLDNDDDDEEEAGTTRDYHQTIIKTEPFLPQCCSNNLILTPPKLCECSTCYYNNNNNVICEVKNEYTLTELKPNSTTTNYYYNIIRTTQFQNNIIYPSTPPPPPQQQHLQPIDYVDHPSFLNGDESIAHNNQFKQRQSYSLDFKLSAIDCYHQDSICRGNQRAVANKYNIHRRQVQKWLKQEDELRSRNNDTTLMIIR